MKSFLAVFALILVLSGPAQARDLNGAIHHAFDVILREEMRNGNPYTGFPIVAPWIVPQIAVSWKFGHLVELDGEMRNFRLDGLDGFIISDVRLSLLTMRFVFDFVWPQVLATGWYNLNGRFGGLIPIFGQGNFRVDPRSEWCGCDRKSFENSWISFRILSRRRLSCLWFRSSPFTPSVTNVERHQHGMPLEPSNPECRRSFSDFVTDRN